MKPNDSMEFKDGSVLIYHVVHEHEGFQQTAENLFALVNQAQAKFPNKRRVLRLDIDGHRNSQGGFDDDMFELQKEFLVMVLAPFLTEYHAPLFKGRNEKVQDNDVPERMVIRDGE
jgi:hypothetical protein